MQLRHGRIHSSSELFFCFVLRDFGIKKPVQMFVANALSDSFYYASSFLFTEQVQFNF